MKNYDLQSIFVQCVRALVVQLDAAKYLFAEKAASLSKYILALLKVDTGSGNAILDICDLKDLRQI